MNLFIDDCVHEFTNACHKDEFVVGTTDAGRALELWGHGSAPTSGADKVPHLTLGAEIQFMQ